MAIKKYVCTVSQFMFVKLDIHVIDFTCDASPELAATPGPLLSAIFGFGACTFGGIGAPLFSPVTYETSFQYFSNCTHKLEFESDWHLSDILLGSDCIDPGAMDSCKSN